MKLFFSTLSRTIRIEVGHLFLMEYEMIKFNLNFDDRTIIHHLPLHERKIDELLETHALPFRLKIDRLGD